MFEEMNNLVNDFIKDIDDVVDNLKLNIQRNEDKINDLLGLKGDARIGIGRAEDDIYFTRSF